MGARFIIHADDFGATVAINRAIVYAHRRGVLAGCSLMVAAKAVDHAVRLASRCERLAIGLHLSLTTPLVAPQRDIPALTGAIPSVLRVVEAMQKGTVTAVDLLAQLALLESRVTLEELEIEFGAQVDRFTAVLGRRPTHLDTHQHIHARPVILEAIARVALRHSLPVRHVSNPMRDELRRRGIVTPDRFREAPTAGKDIPAALSAFLTDLGRIRHGTIELLFHPAFRDRSCQGSTFESSRPQHLRALLGPRLATIAQPASALSYAALVADARVG